MEANKDVQRNYKKWILFNDSLNDYQSLYDLYTALVSKKNTGDTLFYEVMNDGSTNYFIEQKGVESALALVGETERKQLIDYLQEHYFANGDIDAWYLEKAQQKDKAQNHAGLAQEGTRQSLRSSTEVKAHPKERKYYSLRVFFSVVFYLLLIGYLVFMFMTSTPAGVLATLTLLGVGVAFWLLQRVAQGFFVGIIKGNSVKVTEDQYPDIYRLVKTQSEEIGIKEMPEIFISHGHFNAFVTKLARTKYLMLYSEVIETSLKGDFEVVKFIIGHELGHIKRRHLTKDAWLFPSNFVPLLKYAYSRGCEYTCDRIGHSFSQQGALEGILILATGKEIYTKVNIDQFTHNSADQRSFWVWISEKFLSHPHITKRMQAVQAYHKRGY